MVYEPYPIISLFPRVLNSLQQCQGDIPLSQLQQNIEVTDQNSLKFLAILKVEEAVQAHLSHFTQETCVAVGVFVCRIGIVQFIQYLNSILSL